MEAVEAVVYGAAIDVALSVGKGEPSPTLAQALILALTLAPAPP